MYFLLLTLDFATLTHMVVVTVLALFIYCKLLDNCSVQRHNKCTESQIVESPFSWELQQYFCVVDVRKKPASGICRLGLCRFQWYCNLFHAYSQLLLQGWKGSTPDTCCAQDMICSGYSSDFSPATSYTLCVLCVYCAGLFLCCVRGVCFWCLLVCFWFFFFSSQAWEFSFGNGDTRWVWRVFLSILIFFIIGEKISFNL